MDPKHIWEWILPKTPSAKAFVPTTSFYAHCNKLFDKPATPLPTIHTSLSLDNLLLTPKDITYAISRTFASSKSAGLASIPTQVVKKLDLSVHPFISTSFQRVA